MRKHEIVVAIEIATGEFKSAGPFYATDLEDLVNQVAQIDWREDLTGLAWIIFFDGEPCYEIPPFVFLDCASISNGVSIAIFGGSVWLKTQIETKSCREQEIKLALRRRARNLPLPTGRAVIESIGGLLCERPIEVHYSITESEEGSQ